MIRNSLVGGGLRLLRLAGTTFGVTAELVIANGLPPALNHVLTVAALMLNGSCAGNFLMIDEKITDGCHTTLGSLQSDAGLLQPIPWMR